MVIKYKSEYLKRKDTWKYCSVKCKSEHMISLLPIIKCKQCDKEFMKQNKRRTVYCSRQCHMIFSKNRRAEEHYNWKGDKIEYSPLHRWICRNWGNPPKCELCNKIGERKTRVWNIQWSNKDGLYTRNKEDWWGLCVPCHKKYDKEHKQNRAVSIKHTENYSGFYFYKR